MYDVTVTRTDGQEDAYPQVPDIDFGASWLFLTYELEEYSVPLADIRSVKVVFQ